MERESTDQITSEDTSIDVFSGCHDGIVRTFQQLLTMTRLLRENPADSQARQIAGKVLTFFDDIVLLHHAEEEEELFTSVMDCSANSSEAKLAREYTKRLVEEHRDLEAMWASIAPDLDAIAHGRQANLDMQTADKLATQYLAHAAFEEQYYLPLAAKILSPNEKSALGLALHMRHQERAVTGYI